MSPTVVAFVITELDPGGAERMLANVVTRLDRAEWAPVVISLGPPGVVADELAAAGVRVESLDGSGPIDAFRTWRRLRRLLRDLRPALVHCWLFHANVLGRIAAWSAGVRPVVCSLRVAERRQPVHGWVDWATSGFVDRYLCVSQGVLKQARDEWRLPVDKLRVIPNGVDAAKFDAASNFDWTSIGLPAGTRPWLFVGRLESQKGIRLLLDAAETVLGANPSEWLVIAGDGVDREVCEGMVKASAVRDRIRMLGRRSDVPNLLKAAAGLILPSLWEGMPNVVLESMAAGTPVLASTVEGIAELLGDDERGSVFPRGDSQAIVEAWTSAIVNPKMLTQRALAAQAYVRESLTIVACATRHAECYRELLAVRR